MHIVYNPYRVETTVWFLIKDRWKKVDDSSRLNWVRDRRIQRWLVSGQRESSWRGFFAEALEVSGENELKIFFTGTKEDYGDICNAAEQFQTKSGKHIRIQPYSQGSNIKGNTKEELALLQEKIRKAQKSSFWNLLPKNVRLLLNTTLQKVNHNPAFVDLKQLNAEKIYKYIKRYSLEAVVFMFPYTAVHLDWCKQCLTEIAEAVESLGNREMYWERYFFACVYDLEQQEDADKIERDVHKLCLECGLNDMNVYISAETPKNSWLNADNEPGAARLTANIQEYYERYAGQIWLGGLCEEIADAIKQSGILSEEYRSRIGVNVADQGVRVTEGEASAGFNYLSQFYENLCSWNAGQEMIGLCNSICLEVSKRERSAWTEQRPVGHDEEKWIKEEDIMAYVNCWRNYFYEFLRRASAYAIEEIEMKWESTYREFVELYLENEKEPLLFSPEFEMNNMGVLPVDRLQRKQIEEDIALVVRTEKGSIEKAFSRCRKRSLALFESWLKEYGEGLVQQMKEKQNFISKQLPKKKHTEYRVQMKQEKRVRDEAMEWLRQFAQEINHLLDFEEVVMDGK